MANALTSEYLELGGGQATEVMQIEGGTYLYAWTEPVGLPERTVDVEVDLTPTGNVIEYCPNIEIGNIGLYAVVTRSSSSGSSARISMYLPSSGSYRICYVAYGSSSYSSLSPIEVGMSIISGGASSSQITVRYNLNEGMNVSGGYEIYNDRYWTSSGTNRNGVVIAYLRLS